MRDRGLFSVAIFFFVSMAWVDWMYTFSVLRCDKVVLSCRLHGIVGLVPFERVDDPDVGGTPANNQFVIDDVLHDVRQLLLAEVAGPLRRITKVFREYVFEKANPM